MWHYLFAELRHRAGRASAAALGVALGVALFIALTAAGTGFREAARQPLAGVDADILLTRLGGETIGSAQTTRGARLPFGLSTFTLEEVKTVEQMEGVESAAGALLLWDFSPTTYQTVLGVDVNQTALGPGRARDWVVAGHFLTSDETGAVVVDKHFAAFYSLKPGDTVTIGEKPFRVVGIVEAREGSQAAAANYYISLADARALAGLGPEAINQIYVRVAQASAVDDIVQRSRAALGEVSAMTEQSIVQVMGGIARVSERFTGVASLAALLGGLALTWLALSASVAERTREIGVMKAVGWTAGQVARYFLAEGVAVSVTGALAGLGLGWLTTLALGLIPIDLRLLSANAPSHLALNPAASTTLTLPARLTPGPVVLALSLAVVGGAFASWLVARRAAALEPAEALRQ
jgi:putative ABC transport system permease protein